MTVASGNDQSHSEFDKSQKARAIDVDKAIDNTQNNGNEHIAREAGLTDKDVLAAKETTKTAKAEQDDKYDAWKALPGYADDGPTWKGKKLYMYVHVEKLMFYSGLTLLLLALLCALLILHAFARLLNLQLSYMCRTQHKRKNLESGKDNLQNSHHAVHAVLFHLFH